MSKNRAVKTFAGTRTSAAEVFVRTTVRVPLDRLNTAEAAKLPLEPAKVTVDSSFRVIGIAEAGAELIATMARPNNRILPRCFTKLSPENVDMA
jgi:hypothetical protein